jgi:pimeloyl-ACP methyl ester carboxylesterase
MTKKWVLPLGIGVAGVVAGTWVYQRYQRDLRAAKERVAQGGRIIETACGAIEYGIAGEGTPVLVLHGAGGGYDQGLFSAGLMFGEGFQLIAPSRFGYLNSPLPEDSSLEAQADAYACLLDALDIDRVIVAAISAGGPSGFHFARRHPERTAKLIAAAAISYTDPSSAEDRERAASINRVVGSDLIYWLAITAARPLLLELFGMSRQAQGALDPTEMALINQVLQNMLPISLRIDGILLDQGREMPKDFPLEEIKAPTLVIHARDDSMIDYSRGQHTAEKIPGAELMTLEDGGHFLVSHSAELRARVMAFVTDP